MSPGRHPFNGWRWWGGVIWTSPNTLIGLIGGVLAIPFGSRPSWQPQDGAIVFVGWPWGPGGAVTLGNVILATTRSLDVDCRTYAHMAGHCIEPLVRLGDHERAHVLQYMALGPLFLPLYFALGGVSARNPLERAADVYAMRGVGWWPFRSFGRAGRNR